jgi:SAM-dependent methyltransferase
VDCFRKPGRTLKNLSGGQLNPLCQGFYDDGLLVPGPGSTESITWQLTHLGQTLVYLLHEYDLQVTSGRIYEVLDRLNIRPGDEVLDIGCGAGQTLLAVMRYLPGTLMYTR